MALYTIDGSRVHISAGGHFIAASGASVTCSVVPVVGAEPGGSA